MERDRESASFLIRFLDSFLHEKNIKWMLGVGTLILIGSSLRLVSMNWGDFSQVWKYGILLAYTALIFVASEFTYFRLGLRRTGTVLMSLTVALVPLSFYALHWLDPAEPGGLWKIPQQISLASMIAVNFVLSAAVTHRIFVHFLRKPQWTFEFAYLALSLAGAVVPKVVSTLPHFWSYGIFVGLWLIFAAGTLKVNRHVFWLNEEERRPRIFGFFPILLLGAQFLGLFGGFLSNEIPMQWWGLGCVLIAVPVLLTADTVAKVFQQRTGNLVRPLPASIVAPLVVGLILCALGLGLAATGIPRPFALVPTAGLVAVAMGVVAWRTGYQAFTWVGIVCALVAYQFSPLFFLETAKFVVQQGTIAVKETRLPYSFYGLTYLPVLLTFTVASTLLHRSRLDVFAAPLRQAAIRLACLLLLAGFGHPKATFLVSAVMMGLFALQVFCFRRGMLLVPANLALIGTVWGFPTFQMMLTETPTTPASVRFMMALVAVVQLIPGRWINRWSLSLNHSPLTSSASAGLCQQFSLAVTFLTGLSCCLGSLVGIEAAPPFITSMLIGVVFVAHSLLSRDFKTGLTCIIYLNLLVGLYWVNLPYSWAFTLFASVCLLILQWSVGVVLRSMPTSAISQAFAEPLIQFSQVSQVLLSIGGILPLLINSHWMIHEQPFLFWGASGVMAGWFYSAGWQNRDTRYLMGGFFVLLLLPSAILIHQLGTRTGGNWLPLIWSISAITQLAVFNLVERCWNHRSDCREEDREGGWHPSRQLATLVSAILLSVAIGTLFFLHLPARLAAVVALVALFQRRSGSHVLTTQTALACVANWQGMCLLVHLLTGETGLVWQISQQQFFTLLFPISFFAALGVVVIELSLWAVKSRQIPESEIVVLSQQRFLMFLLSCAMLTAQVMNPVSEFTLWQAFAAVATFVCLGFSELVRACREQSVAAVWKSMGIGVVAMVYLIAFQVIAITLGGGMYSLLALCFIFWATGKLVSGRGQLNIMAEPFLTASYWMPLVVVFVGIVLHGMSGSDLWKGSNSLALLISSGFYFFQGMEGHRLRNWMMSAGIMNIALALLWNELQWYDAQLFLIPIGTSILMLVELLRRELPESFHVPMRYIGALTILTSPTFEIISGSWLHLLSLMILSVIILLLAMGLRIRALVYTGTAFLIADLIALVVRGGLDHPNLLWVAGVVLGVGVIGLAAYCEHHREKLMSRIRMISAELETWR